MCQPVDEDEACNPFDTADCAMGTQRVDSVCTVV